MLRRSFLALAWSLAALAIVLAATLGFAQTGSGKRLIAEQLGALLSSEDTVVRLEGLSGTVPFDLRLERLQVADADGVWLEIEGVAVTTAPRSLLRGRLDLAFVGARRIGLSRLPAGEGTEPSEPLSLPTSLPPVVVREVGIEQFELGEAVLGEPAVFNLAGRLAARDGGRTAEVDIDLRRLDEDTAQASIDARIGLDPLALDLTATATETGGLLAALTGHPEAGAFTFELRGDGPLDDWSGRLDADGRGVARTAATIELALGDRPDGRVDGTFEPAPGFLPADVAELLGDRVEFSIAATQAEPQSVSVDELRVATALARFGATGTLALDTEAMTANATVEAADLAPLGDLIGIPAGGSVEVEIGVHGTMGQPEGRVTIAAADLRVAEVRARRVETSLDLAVLEPLDRPDAMARISGGGKVSGLALPPAAPFPPQDVTWEVELGAPVNGQGSLELRRMALDAGHTTLTATGTVDTGTLAGDGRITLAARDLAALSAPFGQRVHGVADLAVNVTRAEAAEAIGLELSGEVRDLAGLPPGAAELLGPAPSLSANASLRPSERVDLHALSLTGAEAAFDAALELSLPDQTMAGNASLDLPRLAALSSVAGVPLDGPLQLNATLGGTTTAPSIRLAAQSPGLLVDGRHIDALALTATAAGTAAALDGAVRLAVAAAGTEVELASDVALREQVLTARDVALTAPRSRIGGEVEVDLARQRVEGQLAGRLQELGEFRELLPIALRGELELEARASVAADGTQRLGIAAEAREVRTDVGRLTSMQLQGNLADAFGTPRVTADLALDGVRSDGFDLDRARIRADGPLDDLPLDLSAAGETPIPYDLDGRVRIGVGDQVRVIVDDLGGQLVGQPLALRAPATITVAGERIAVDPLDLAWAQARLVGSFAMAPGEVAADVRLDSLDLATLATFGVPPLEGRASAALGLRGRPENPSGTVTLEVTDLATGTVMFADLPPAKVSLTGNLEARRLSVALLGEGVTERPIRLEATLPVIADLAAGAFDVPADGAIDGSLDAELQLARLADLAGLDDQRLEGPLRADLTLGGTVGQPRVDGTVAIEDGLYEHGGTGTVLRQLTLRLRAANQTLTVEQLSATDGADGRVEGRGTIDLGQVDGGAVDVQVTLRSARLVARDDVVATMSADLAASGPLDGPRLAGEITVERADVWIPESFGPQVAALDVEWAEDDERSTATEAPPVDLGLDLTVNVPGRVFVRGRGLESEWEGRLRIEGTATAPTLAGQLRIRRGDFDLLGRRFDLRDGTISFTGTSPPKPRLDLAAVARAEEILAVVRLRGDATDPKLTLDSEPSLPEDEVLSRLLFGKEPGELGPAEAVKLAAAVNTLRGGVDLMSATGSALGLDTLGVRGGETAEDSQLRAGSYLSDRVFIEAGAGAGEDTEDVRVEVEILPDVFLDADTSARGNSGVGVRWRYEY